MKYVLIFVAILSLPIIASAAEDTLILDRCVILNSEDNQAAESKIALHFPLPEDLTGKEIQYAELSFQLPSMSLDIDSLYEITFCPCLANWSDDDITYDNSQTLTDSLSSGSFIKKLGDENELHVDLTQYLVQVNEGQRQNYGLIGLTDLLGDGNLRLPDNLGETLRGQARIRVVYK